MKLVQFGVQKSARCIYIRQPAAYQDRGDQRFNGECRGKIC
jgi:hypothetical protein